MALNFTENTRHDDLSPRITVFGVGGAGGNAVNNMIEKALEGVEFVVANTDAQALQQSRAPGRIQMGVKITEGLGAGARPSVGSAAAEETIEEIIDHLAGSHMCFITAGMGGGTGTGAAPIIAQAARELGVLTVGVVTKPFQFEGSKRMRQAEEGVEALQKVVDTLIIIPNQNLFRLANEKTTFTEAFAMADDVLYQGVKGVTDLMVRPGLINLDFADVRAVMDEMGKAMMGTGEATGEDRAIQAAEKAIANPLLDEISLHGARGVLINITGGYDLTLFELDEAANRIREKVDPEANIIVGSTLDPAMEGALRVSVVATGIDVAPNTQVEATPRRSMSTPVRAEIAEKPASQPSYAEQAPAPAPAPAARDAEDHAEQRNLFERVPAPEPVRQPASQPAAAQQAPAQDSYRPQSDNAGQYAGDYPQQAPRYTGRAQAPVEAHEDQFDIDSVLADQQRAAAARPMPGADFTAPRRQMPGTPSPETLAKLQRAVQKAPEAGYNRPPVEREEAAADRSAGRFGIGSLISRMAGHASEGQGAAQRRVAPPVTQYDEDPTPAPSDDRIEIPAFLRRQAN
ncbi:cell division protein FtsZ [Roseinatronobacter bogoriensis]|uniref:Cell division protein FtsZ n=1 Tax=Roseinatronobacter bogoriensis subsp. barguzinensis TaxID=441209 RepID=A0A2K8K916_9RHOB|nr:MULTISPECIES: cell division protein FtsZ [Rhodobaca]ATX65942.1 cell division protein FtsZ [Rhodobaca barguzinensis]MBB4208077.1 cell division protein FtsZ [Rhodobaca bogoriensis DSM 18756]TDW38717.1 cell division protein FtsZ [Rhodobaca barguzinensis]TDY69245.1 cell division protein FtsZ [Rhodobaca bogoriensis DSM 18756]